VLSSVSVTKLSVSSNRPSGWILAATSWSYGLLISPFLLGYSVI